MVTSTIFKQWYIDTDNPITALVVDSVLAVYSKYFDMDNDIDCLITFWESGYPMCCPKRLNYWYNYSYCIYLDCEQTLWSKMIYQLSHEISHLFMNCYPDNINFKWVSECLCEAASMFVLEKIFEIWLQPPYYHLAYKTVDNSTAPYAYAILNYLADIIKNIENISSLHGFYVTNQQWLADDPNGTIGEDRPRNKVFAFAFYKLIQENPKGWTSVIHMHDKALSENANIVDYFKQWENQCLTQDEKIFVSGIVNLLEL